MHLYLRTICHLSSTYLLCSLFKATMVSKYLTFIKIRFTMQTNATNDLLANHYEFPFFAQQKEEKVHK